MFSKIKGHDLNIKILENTLSEQNIPQVFLFTGIQGIGKRLISLQSIRYFNCQGTKKLDCDCFNCKSGNSTLIQIYPPITVDKAREIKQEANKKPLVGDYKFFIIEDFDKATLEASNALLKILEEPNKSSIFFLLAQDLDKVLDTIQSRCFILNFHEVKNSYISEFLINNLSIDKDKADNVAKLSGGSFSKAMEFLSADRRVLRKITYEFLLKLPQTSDKTILSNCDYLLEKGNVNNILDDILLFLLDARKIHLGIEDVLDNTFDMDALSLQFTSSVLDSAFNLIYYNKRYNIKDNLFLNTFFLDLRGIMKKELVFEGQ